MAKIPEPFDRRILERNMRKGLVSRQEYQKYLEQLPDVESNAEVVDLGLDDAGDAAPTGE